MFMSSCAAPRRIVTFTLVNNWFICYGNTYDASDLCVRFIIFIWKVGCYYLLLFLLTYPNIIFLTKGYPPIKDRQLYLWRQAIL